MVRTTSTVETDKTYRFPLVGNNQQRNTTSDTDQRFINFYPETSKNPVTAATKLFLVKRPGFSLDTTVVSAGGEGRGAWSFNNKLYSVVGSTLYENTTAKQVLSTTTGMCGAVEIYGDQRYLFLADGIDAWTVDTSGTITRVDTVYLKWTPTEIVEIGDRRRPATAITPTNYWYTATTKGTTDDTEPTWPTTIGATVTDGTVVWKCSGEYIDQTEWEASTAYTYGDIIVPTTENGFFYKCIIAGTSTTAEPDWPLIVGDTVIDGASTSSVKSVAVSSGGLGYISPQVTLSGGGGSGATAVAVVGALGTITEINVTNGGTGYTEPPTVTIADTGYPPGAGAIATAELGTASDTLTWECVGQYGGFPTPHIPTPVYLDGYVFLAEASGRDIYNSDVNQPYGWGALSFITADSYSDDIVGLARQNNYVVAFGTSSTELFYDKAFTTEESSAFTTTGLFQSPLQRNESIMAQVGCLSYNTLLQSERILLFIGESNIGGRSVWLMEGTTFKEISLEYIEKFLDAETDTEVITGYGFRINGHLFFHINLPTLKRTFVYDVEEKMWHEWSYLGNEMPFSWFVEHSGKILLQHKTDGKLYKLSTTTYQDAGSDITCDAITAKFDFETDKRKFFKKITVIGDTQPIVLQLRWSDDDYTTWNDWKLLSTGMRPILWRAGQARRRAYNLRHVGNVPTRLEALEMVYSIGET